jgi:PAS domain S-box-containing protein
MKCYEDERITSRRVLIISDNPQIGQEIAEDLCRHEFTTSTTSFRSLHEADPTNFQADLALIVPSRALLSKTNLNVARLEEHLGLPVVLLDPFLKGKASVHQNKSTLHRLPNQIPDDLLAFFLEQILRTQRLQQALHQRAVYCDILMRDLSDGLFILEASGEIRFADPAIQRLIGQSAEELSGCFLPDLLHPEDRSRLTESLRHLRKGPRLTDSLSCRLRPNAGDWHVVEATLTNHLEDPEIKGFIFSIRDMTEQELAAEKLQQRNQELALLNQAARAFSATLNLDEVLARVLEETRHLMNVVACSIWLIEPESDTLVCRQATGPQREIVQGWQLPKDQGLVGWVTQTGESLNVHDVLSDKRHFKHVDDATGLSLRSILTVPLRTKDAIIGALQALDSEAQRFTESDVTLLEALAGSAASAIENARLVDVLKRRTRELKESNEELEAFAHTVAHDLKSPLTHIVGYADILFSYNDNIGSDRAQTYIQAIQRSGHKMTNIIDELLLLAQLRQEEVNVVPLEMGRIVKEALSRLRLLIERHDAEVQIPESWPWALGYAPWIEEVWTNYLSNAIKYGGTPPRVVLGAEHVDDTVRFWVKDNGKGLTKEEQERLFIPFTRMDEIRAQGYGLGLSIVQRIVKKLNGEVWVDSTVGEGSTFGFTLPASEL